MENYRNPNSEKSRSFAGIEELLHKEINIFSSKISDKQKEAFYSDMGMLLFSGVDIRTSLDIIISDQKKKDSILYSTILTKIINGSSFSSALEESKKFSDYEFYSIRIGEESGRLSEVLIDLSHYFSRRIKQKRQIISVLTYPVIVLITTFLALAFMLRFIVPMFVQVFQRFGTNLPDLTKMILNLSSFLAGKSIYIIFIFIAIFLTYRIFRKKTWFRKATSSFYLKIPFFGSIIRKLYTARFCQSMSFLGTAKTPMLKSLQLVKRMIHFYPLQIALSEIEDDLLNGSSLNQGMARFPIFDKRIVSLIRAGEEINHLDQIFAKLSTQLSDEIDHDIGVFNNILEPLIIIFVGGMVGLILIAMYLPIFQLGTSIG